MTQKKNQSRQNAFNQTLIGDYYINTLDAFINNNENKNIDELRSFMSKVNSNETVDEFNGSFDDYFNQTLKNNDEKKV